MEKEETKEELLRRMATRKEQLESQLRIISASFHEDYEQQEKLTFGIRLLDEFLP